MRRTFLVTIVTAALTILLLVGLAAGQAGALAGLAQPILVSVDQAIPADITVAIAQEDGEVIEATIPITVGVSLQVVIDGENIVVVAPRADAEDAAITVEALPVTADGEPVDGAGRTYTVEVTDGLLLEQVESSENGLGGVSIFGDITNTSDDTAKRVQIIATLYDDAGTMLGVETTFAKLQEIESGQTSPFQVLSMIEAKKVVSYRLQIGAN
jgi:hypothetical protein